MKAITLTFSLLFSLLHFGQYCESFSLTLEDELELGCANSTLTALHDQLDRPYVYAANGPGGLTVINSSDPEDLSSEIVLDVADFEDLNVNSITQEGNYLYIALGSLFGAHDQNSGLAIIDVEDPTAPFVTDVWQSDENAGAASVAINGDYAYLSALANGVIVLNISNKEAISFVSQYIPDTDWPAATDLSKINARNIVLDGNTAYLAYDAGGMRILDIGNPAALDEIGRFSNPAMDGAARAYNNIVKDGNLLYIAVDYAGMEVLNVSDPDAVTLEGWWNPNGFPLETPAATSLVWFSSEWHTNEIDLIPECSMLFLSCGRTELIGIDVSDPSDPEFCGSFGVPDDEASTWGMTVYGDRIYLGMICTLGIPFPGTWAGVKSLVFDSDCPLGINENDVIDITIYPNPATSEFNIQLNEKNISQFKDISIFDFSGKLYLKDTSGNTTIGIDNLDAGIYIVKLNFEGYQIEQKLVIQ